MLKIIINFKIIYTLTLFVLTIFSSSVVQAKKNIFVVDNIQIEEKIDKDFSREKIIKKTFHKAFKELLLTILLSKDYKNINKLNLSDLNELIESIQINEEIFRNNEYKASYNIEFNENRTTNFLEKNNLFYSYPVKTNVLIFPILKQNKDIKIFEQNVFYNNFLNHKVDNNLIDYILPLPDLDVVIDVKNLENDLEEIEIEDLSRKYEIKNTVILVMRQEDKLLNVYYKINMENNKFNFSEKFPNIDLNNKEQVADILNNLNIRITDSWKQLNIVKFSSPLNINLIYKTSNLIELENLEKTFSEINIIEGYQLIEYNIYESAYRIYYNANPKKLSSLLSKNGYEIRNEDGIWILTKNE